MTAKVCFRSPKRGDFHIRATHELSVPDESKHEDETKRCDECDKEFFPIHNFSRLRFLLIPLSPKGFFAKPWDDVDSNFCLAAALSCSANRNISDCFGQAPPPDDLRSFAPFRMTTKAD